MRTSGRVGLWIGLLGLGLGHSACGKTSSDEDATGGMAGSPSSGGAALGGRIEIPTSGGYPGSGGAGTGGAPEGFLAVCDVGDGPSIGDPAQSLEIEDFEDESDAFSGNGLNGSWFAFTDLTGMQSPTDYPLPPVAGGVAASGFALRIQGGGHTEWGAGFGALLAYNGPAVADNCVFNASAYTGISFWARGSIEPDGSATPGNAGNLRFKVSEKDVRPTSEGGNCPEEAQCYDSHGKNITLGQCWQKYEIAFSELNQEGWGYPAGELDLDELFVIEFGVGQGQVYDIWLDDVRFFVGSKELETPLCSGTGGASGVGGASSAGGLPSVGGMGGQGGQQGD